MAAASFRLVGIYEETFTGGNLASLVRSLPLYPAELRAHMIDDKGLPRSKSAATLSSLPQLTTAVDRLDSAADHRDGVRELKLRLGI
jgi:hypothetical protein